MPRRRSGEQPDRLQRHDHAGARHQAPETRDHGRHHDELKTAPLDASSAKCIAHDDEGRSEDQEWNRSKCPSNNTLLQQSESLRGV